MKKAGYGFVELLISVPIYNLNEEKIDEYVKKIQELQDEKKYYNDTSELNLYEKDLKNLTK